MHPMANVFNFQSFWKSRFQLHQDRGYLKYLLDNSQGGTADWRLRYRNTADITCEVFLTDGESQEFQNRRYKMEHLSMIRELWMQAEWLRERYTMTRASDTQILLHKHLLADPKLCWEEFDAGVQCDRFPNIGENQSACGHCGADHVPLVQAVPLKSSVTGLAVSILRERMTTIITGFELLDGDEKTPNLKFGYRVPGRQVIIDFRGRTLKGFTIFSSQGHIHAFSLIFDVADFDRHWIGQPTICKGLAGDHPCTRHDQACRGYLDPFELCDDHKCIMRTKGTTIVLGKGITALCGKFDVRRSESHSMADK